jgi:hypothetical protein
MNIIDWLKRLILGSITPSRPPAGTSPFSPGQGPARLLIMRHGEKTGDNSDPYLSAHGQQRAERLATYIPQQFGPPDFLIAARTSKKSQRPYDTIAPLANALGLTIKEKFDDNETDALVEHLGAIEKYAGKSGVIAWRHGNIPSLLEALGAPDGSYPQAWDDRVFNLIIEMTFSDGTAPRLRQITEPF